MSNQIALIGTGNLAYHLAKKFSDSGAADLTVISRSKTRGRQFLQSLNLNGSVETGTDHRSHQTVILAVPDGEIRTITEERNFSADSLLVHTSGSIPMKALGSKTSRVGVLYPLQTFTAGQPIDFERIPVFLEANNDTAQDELIRLARMLTSNIYFINSHERLNIHMAAVIACNFTNNLFAIAESLLASTSLDFGVLEELTKESLQKALRIGPKNAQTGPAVRKDLEVIQTHLDQLSDKDLINLYKLHTKMIQKLHL